MNSHKVDRWPDVSDKVIDAVCDLHNNKSVIVPTGTLKKNE